METRPIMNLVLSMPAGTPSEVAQAARLAGVGGFR